MIGSTIKQEFQEASWNNHFTERTSFLRKPTPEETFQKNRTNLSEKYLNLLEIEHLVGISL